MKDNHLYLRAFFEAYAALINNAARLAPSHMRKELIEQAHLYATEAVSHLNKTMSVENEVRRKVQ
jgi:hypothetical protein